MPPSRIGRTLKRLREARGWSLSDLARRAKLSSPAHVSLIESGGRRNLTATTVQRLAKALGVPATDLLK